MSSKYRGRLRGLCGNFNGDRRDDFFGLDGSVHPDGQSFGDSNRVGGLRALQYRSDLISDSQVSLHWGS